MTKNVLVLNIGFEQQPLIKNLFHRGYNLYAVHHNEVYQKNNYKGIIICDYSEIESIKNFIKGIKFDAVISDQCDYANMAQSILSEELNLPTHTTKAAEISSDKSIQRILSRKKGINIPEFKILSNKKELENINLKYPLIIKPIDNRGSIGISVAKNKNQLKKSFDIAFNNSKKKKVIAENFIYGTEYTVDGYCFEKKPKTLAIAKKQKIGVDSQVSTDIQYVPNIEKSLYNKLSKHNEDVIKKLGFNFGFTHSEYIVDSKQNIYLVESANRGGGMFTSELIVPNVTGIDLVDIYINDCLGLKTKLDKYRVIKNTPTILKFFVFPEGKVKRIKGLKYLESSKKVLKYGFNFGPGDVLKGINDDSKRHGFVIYTSTANIRDEITCLMNKIKIEYEL